MAKKQSDKPGNQPGEQDLPDPSELFGDNADDLETTGDRGDSLPDPNAVDQDDPDLQVDPMKGEGDEEEEDRGDDNEPKTEGDDEPEKDEDDPEKGEDDPEKGEDDPEKGESDDDDEKQGGRKKQPMIPKDRFDEVNQRRKAAEEKLREREEEDRRRAQEEGKQDEPEIDFDFDAKEEEYQDALLEGDKDKAKGIRKEIREAESQLYEARARRTSSETVERTSARRELQNEVVEAQAEYPELDGDSDQFNKAMSDEAMELYQAYQASGQYTPGRAMRKAVQNAARLHGVKPLSQRGEPEPTPAGPAQPAEPPKPDDKPTEQQVAGKVATARQQPANPGTRTHDTGVPDIMSLSEKEFDELSNEELAGMRGDTG